MLTIALSIAGTAAAYRGLLAAAKTGASGSKRERIYAALGGGPGPFRPQ